MLVVYLGARLNTSLGLRITPGTYHWPERQPEQTVELVADERDPEAAMGDGDHHQGDAEPEPVATPVSVDQPIAVGGGPSL
jgi:hypothetical protein